MKKWLFGVLAVAAVLGWPTVAGAFQASQAGQPAPLSREFQPKPYTVGPGDKVRLEFYNLSDSDVDMKKEYLVEAAGTIQVKYVGSISVNGLTTAGIEAAVKKALEDKQLYPAGVIQVTAQVTDERMQSVVLNGQVVSPGEKQLRGAQMTVSRAINQAGGFTPNAGQEIEIHRTVNGKTEIIAITRAQLDGGDDPPLIADDTVVVKQGHVFFVNGQVNSPGQKVWAPGMTVLRAVSLAGGMTPKGKYGYIMRPDKDADGKVIRYKKIDKLKDETLILPDDQLHIAAKWFGG